MSTHLGRLIILTTLLTCGGIIDVTSGSCVCLIQYQDCHLALQDGVEQSRKVVSNAFLQFFIWLDCWYLL